MDGATYCRAIHGALARQFLDEAGAQLAQQLAERGEFVQLLALAVAGGYGAASPGWPGVAARSDRG